MPTKGDLLRARARRFAVRLILFSRAQAREPAVDALLRQVVRSGTGISANYQAACRARSTAEFIAKLGVVVEEADETENWLIVWRDSGLGSGAEFEWLLGEASELRAIFWASLRTARLNQEKRKPK